MSINEPGTPNGRRRLWLIVGLVCVIAVEGWLYHQNMSREKSAQPPAAIQKSIPRPNKDKVQPSISIGESTANKETITGYITNFLKQGYEKYYAIQEINHLFVSQEQNGGQLEAVVMSTMKSRIKDPVSDPDTVPYIKEAREKAEKENDPDIKKVDQKIYETLKREYGRVEESNFTFKLTAQLDSEMIDESSIKLYLVQDAEPNHTEYLPAEELFRK